MDNTLSIDPQVLSIEIDSAVSAADLVKLTTVARHLVDALMLRDKECQDLSTDLDNALDQIAQIGKKLDLQEANKDSNGTIVSINDADYLLIGKRFITRKGELNAVQLSKDTELLAEMLEKKSGCLQPAKQPVS